MRNNFKNYSKGYGFEALAEIDAFTEEAITGKSSTGESGPLFINSGCKFSVSAWVINLFWKYLKILGFASIKLF